MAYCNLANVYLLLEDYPEAQKAATEALEMATAVGCNNDLMYATIMQNFGDANRGMGDFAAAEKSLKKCLQIKEQKLPANDPEWANLYCDLGKLYRDMGDQPQAEQYFLLALHSAEKALGENHSLVGYTCKHYARCLRKQGRDSESESFEKRAADIEGYRSSPNFYSSLICQDILYRNDTAAPALEHDR